MQPKVLKELVKFLEATGDEDKSYIERYEWFVSHGDKGKDCKYAELAKSFFLKDGAEQAAKAIIWLYNNWAINYK